MSQYIGDLTKAAPRGVVGVTAAPKMGAAEGTSTPQRSEEKWVLVRNGIPPPSQLVRFGAQGIPDETSPADGPSTDGSTTKVPAIPAGPPPCENKALGVIGRMNHPAIHEARKKASKDGLIRVRLWQKISQSQATTALVTASALQPGSANGYTELSALYDSARCLGIDFFCFASSGSVTNNDSWVVAFDPGLTGNLSSVILGLEHKCHVGPLALSSTASGAATGGVASATGFHRFRGKTVKQFQSGVSNDIIGSEWYPSGTTSGIVGYLKPYVENGAGGTVYLVTYVAYDMEFKFRG